MALTLTTADQALKEDYQDMIREQLNQTNFLLSQVDNNTKDVEGRFAVLSLHVSRNSGVGARAEYATLPTAGSQGYIQERVPLKYNYGRIAISGPVIRAMKSDKGSFVRAIDSEVKGVTADLKRAVNRQLFGDTTGHIATCGTTSSSVTVVLAAATSVAAIRQIQDQGRIDIGTVSNSNTIVAAANVLSVDTSAKTVTIDSAVSTTSADFIVASGTNPAGNTNNIELTGLQALVNSSGTLFNVDPSTYQVWKSYKQTSVGSISDTVFQKAMDETRIASGEDVNLIITTAGVSRAYAASLTSQKRFSNTIELKGGFSGISVNAGRGDEALVWDRDCPDGFAFGLSTAHLAQHQASDWEFMDQDGAVLSRVPNTDAYEATLFKYHELTTDQRNTHFVLTGITEA